MTKKHNYTPEKKNELHLTAVEEELKKNNLSEDIKKDLIDIQKILASDKVSYNMVDARYQTIYLKNKLVELQEYDLSNAWFVSVNIMEEYTSKSGKTKKRTLFIKREDLPNFSFDKYKKRILTQFNRSLPSNYGGFVSCDVKWDERFYMWLPHFHIILFNATKDDLNKWTNQYYKIDTIRKISNMFYESLKNPNPLLKDYGRVNLKSVVVEEVDNQKVGNYILKFATYARKYYVRNLTILPYKDKNIKSKFKPESSIMIYQLLFYYKLKKGKSNYWSPFNINNIPTLNSKSTTSLVVENNNEENTKALQLNNLLSNHWVTFVENKGNCKLITSDEQGFNNALKIYGYNAYRDNQKECIKHIINNKNTLLILPTSSGKSMTYEVASLMEEGITLIIEPLVALMNEHSSKLNNLLLNSSIARNSFNRSKELQRRIEKGDVKFIHVSPELLTSEKNGFSDILKNLPINRIVIEECHLVELYNYIDDDNEEKCFRFKYGHLAEFIIKNFPKVKITCLTGTADEQMIEDISKSFFIEEKGIFKKDIKRNNISYFIHKKGNNDTAEKFLVDLINEDRNNHQKQSVPIVFCTFTDTVACVKRMLKKNGIKAVSIIGNQANNSELIEKAKKEHQVIIGTKCIGVGVDVDNATLVVHYEPSLSLIEYLQESGRVGRLGQPSKAYLFYSDRELDYIEKTFVKSDLEKNRFAKVKKYIKNPIEDDNGNIDLLYDLS